MRRVSRRGVGALSLIIMLLLAILVGYSVYRFGLLDRYLGFYSPPKQAPSPGEMRAYALSEINVERSKAGLRNVTLSPIDCAQGHADEMLQGKYLSHWGFNGSKPYMRYTSAGGRGLVAENAAYISSTGTLDAYRSIHELNWSMVYNDSGSNWGHRDNLLNPEHNRVSIGVAFDGSTLSLVQDFEDYYFTVVEVKQSGSVVSLTYTSTISGWKPEQVGVYYDSLPQLLTKEELSSPPYNGSYGSGELVGGVVPKGYHLNQGVTVNASSWSTTGSTLSTSFDLSKIFSTRGVGVYTLYIADSSGTYTSVSVWYK
ncbi:MAG: CAP domain-containing protein [Candidatus Bathyarchaeota archaeon]|nr:CAP domain-containing protein [Candidatus Bathyarchaeota archaeon]